MYIHMQHIDINEEEWLFRNRLMITVDITQLGIDRSLVRMIQPVIKLLILIH